ncbi:Lipid II:glycine glycyltransferase (Peptidoglycan interpeptide bridge formation enzyme) [Mariniphaga anaerophila]|uniref:Lipid II:glycine glycyltransferase (Peptidoglycan interpeptide bridge formation enzyme) n=1 Tax=Mariniphaga anaerophila TaxID=1484053 RepID=A0A1M5E1H3_9BACT|nr:peptidoglycan bridge formation glycyltransferase FemA/FemB family protein [Mariniphaga anaerophila]SHF73020.1 Lipid II:glycine glycyltransferase (Peptidoglycan interpeptide bridge formation enzyme) [Mariniphaga anaerophila]
MHCKIEGKDLHDIVTTNIVQQSSFWGKIKNRQGFDPVAFEYHISDDLLFPASTGRKTIQDDLLVLLRYVDREHCIAYIPYGPEEEPVGENQGVFMEELSEVLRSCLPKNCILIRYDLPWENQWAREEDFFDNQGNWMGPPSHQNQEFRVNFNTHNWNLMKSPSDNLPSNTIFLDLAQGEDALLKKMKPKTRYNIRLSLKKGVRVESYGLGMIDTWYDLYKETSARNSFTLHKKENFRTFLEMQNSGDVDTRLLVADYDGEYLAAMFLVLSQKRGTYMYGASSGNKRNLMATYAVQWKGIQLAKQAGCDEYDMFGAAPNPNSSHPMHGLYRFKSGFGGEMIHRMGCWDYPLDKEQYRIFRMQELNGPGYHVN